MIIKFALFKRHYSFNFRTYKELNFYVAGITNKCKDGKYVLFLDYDDVPEEWVVEELSFLVKEFFLGDTHLFKTNNGFHAICTTKRSLRNIIEVMRDSSTDSAYKWVPLKRARKVWTLRTTEKDGKKPEFITTVKGNNRADNKESKPHNEILRKLYSLEIPTSRDDGEEDFWTAHYHINQG